MKHRIEEYFKQLISFVNGKDLPQFLSLLDNITSHKYLKTLSNDEKNSLLTNIVKILNEYLEQDPNDELYLRKGIILGELGDYNEAILSYLKVLETNQDNYRAYYNLGYIYNQTQQYQLALDSFKKASLLPSKDHWVYSKIGDTYMNLDNLDEALVFYKKAIDINPSFEWGYYDLAGYYLKMDEYEKAISYYKKVLEFDLNEKSYLRKRSQEIIFELSEQIKNSTYKEISLLIDEIKELLYTDDSVITHYTSLSTANALIANKSKFRLSEATYINDTSEGKTLFNFLGITEHMTKENQSYLFIQKPFIGSFVNSELDDNLTLWRMYGKEGKEEAEGCSLKFDGNKFISDYLEKIKNIATQWNEDVKNEFKFYRVAYIDNNTCQSGNKKNDRILKSKLNSLKTKIESTQLTPSMRKRIGEITFLFKTSEYQHENETRLVLSGSVFNEIVDKNFNPAKVYIELNSIISSLIKVTIGPKVKMPEEWAAAFHYSMKQNNKNIDIAISTLPYK